MTPYEGVITIPTEGKTYTTSEVARIVSIPRKTLLHWVSQRLLSPGPGTAGRNHGHRWSEKDLQEVKNLIRFRGKRLPIRAMAEVKVYLQEIGHNPFSRGDFTIERDPTGRLLRAEKTMDGLTHELLPESRGQLVFDMDGTDTD